MFFQDRKHCASSQIAGTARISAAHEKKILSFIERRLGECHGSQDDPLREQKKDGKHNQLQSVFVFHSLPIRVAEDKTDFTVNGGELAEFGNAAAAPLIENSRCACSTRATKYQRSAAGAMLRAEQSCVVLVFVARGSCDSLVVQGYILI